MRPIIMWEEEQCIYGTSRILYNYPWRSGILAWTLVVLNFFFTSNFSVSVTHIVPRVFTSCDMNRCAIFKSFQHLRLLNMTFQRVFFFFFFSTFSYFFKVKIFFITLNGKKLNVYPSSSAIIHDKAASWM